MQFSKLSGKIKPITLAVGLMAMPNAHAYADIDNYSGITATSGRLAQYIDNVNNAGELNLYQWLKFQSHLQKWQQKTQFMSSAYSIVNDVDFQAIVGMGKKAVPFIVEEIEARPSTLVWALNYIFGQKISNNLTITEACKLWVKAIS